jgi:hypothetical protein
LCIKAAAAAAAAISLQEKDTTDTENKKPHVSHISNEISLLNLARSYVTLCLSLYHCPWTLHHDPLVSCQIDYLSFQENYNNHWLASISALRFIQLQDTFFGSLSLFAF